jgi:DEAD/DEAH box helicase domain-containing protein
VIDHIVVDVETTKLFKEVQGGRESLDKLGVGCAVIYSYLDDGYAIYKQNCVEELKERLLKADKITGFNTYKFDYPVIWGMKLKDWLGCRDAQKIIPKTNDILRRVWISLGLNPMEFTGAHRGLSLNNICTATLNEDKSKMGEDAPFLLRDGEWDLVLTYCLHDVKLTKNLADFIDKYGYVVTADEKVIRIWAEPNEVV